jgi:hypothetical protein
MITMDAKAGKGAYWLEADGKRSRIWTLGTLELDATLETIIETLARALRARGYRLGIVLAERGLGGLRGLLRDRPEYLRGRPRGRGIPRA